MSENELFTVEDGMSLIKFARDNIENYLTNNKRIVVPTEIKAKFGDKYGAFVTLNKVDDEGNSDLRGCIGYIEPTYALYDVVHRVSISSATEDPRFPHVTSKEMDKMVNQIKSYSTTPYV